MKVIERAMKKIDKVSIVITGYSYEDDIKENQEFVAEVEVGIDRLNWIPVFVDTVLKKYIKK